MQSARLLAVVMSVAMLVVVVKLQAPAGALELAQAAVAVPAAAAAGKGQTQLRALAQAVPAVVLRQTTAAKSTASVPPRRSAKHVAVGATAALKRKARKVISGKAIFKRMVTVLGRVAKAHKKAKVAPPTPPGAMPAPRDVATKAFQQALSQSLMAEQVNEDGEIDVDDDPPAQTVYVYRGRETKTKTDELVTFILAGGFGIPDIKYIESSSDADIRKALWDEDCRAVIFPPLKDMPDFGPTAVKDMRAFVSHGMHHSGTMLFMGSSVEVHIINNIFGYQLEQDFKPGPYYKNERGVLQTALQMLPSRVNELGNTDSLGVLTSSMPPEARSYYDSFGDSVAMCVRYDLGRVCYLAQDFKPLMQMPELQLELAGAGDEDEEVQREAERELEALGRKTDTWLAIFQVCVCACVCVCESAGVCMHAHDAHALSCVIHFLGLGLGAALGLGLGISLHILISLYICTQKRKCMNVHLWVCVCVC